MAISLYCVFDTVLPTSGIFASPACILWTDQISIRTLGGTAIPMAPLGHATTCSPKVLAVPITVLAMDSSLRCLRWSSLALIFAISYTCFNDIVPIISCPGRAGPFSNPAVCFKSQVVGGVLVTKLNVRSGCTVILVGIGTPGSMWPVLALNSLQKSMDFTPRAPRAGPTGGLGVAFPAAINRRTRWA